MLNNYELMQAWYRHIEECARNPAAVNDFSFAKPYQEILVKLTAAEKSIISNLIIGYKQFHYPTEKEAEKTTGNLSATLSEKKTKLVDELIK